MNPVPHNEAFLLSQFREFYSEVIRLKRLVKSSGWVSPGHNGSHTGKENGARAEAGTWVYFPESSSVTSVMLPKTAGSGVPDPQVTSEWTISGDYANQPPVSDQTNTSLFVWQSLLALFRRNALQVVRVKGAPTESYFEAQYVMAALADEVFIHMDWEGNRAWASNLLESTLFQTHVAGELFFDKLDRLLRDRNPADKSLAAVYLNALSLGFKGKYYGVDDQNRLRRYRSELFTFVFNRQADLNNDSRVAFPDAYARTLKRETKKKLTNPRLWVGLLCLVFLSYLVVSHAIWLSLTSRLEAANRNIVEIENQLDATPVKKP